MTKMTVAYLGLLVLVTYLSKTVSSQNATDAPANATTASYNMTTMGTNAYSSAANVTTPGGAGTMLRSGAFSILLPVAMAASLLRNRC